MKLAKIAKRNLKIFKMDEITIESSSYKPSGGYGEVTRAIIKDGNIPIVLKKYKKNIASTILSDDIIREIVILQHLNQYPETRTVELLGICFDSARNYCFLVLESLETDLHRISVKYKNDDTKNRGRFNNHEYKIIFYKCLKALNAIHSLGFIHNDIKLGNIMLNGSDIKFIDFGLSKYLGISPLYPQVNDYITTPEIKAPESRISFSTDMFSLAVTMLHLTMRDYRILRASNIGEIYDKNTKEIFNGYLSADRVFGKIGIDLLLKMMDNDPKNRWCANRALHHPYFDEIQKLEKLQNLEIDRSVVGLLGGNPISGLTRQIEYSIENFQHKNMELCYYEELHINYKDDICPIRFIENNIAEYHELMNWLLGKFNHINNPNNIFYGIDIIINGIIMTNDKFLIYKQKPQSLSPIINSMIVHTTLNMMIFNDIFTDGRLNCEYMLENRVKTHELVGFFYNNLNIDINVHPISVHISYIYLQLLFDIKQLSDDFKFTQDFFHDVCVMVIFWFIQPIPYDEPVTNWEVVVFSTLRLLSKILSVSGIELIKNPLTPIVTMDESKYSKMLEYFNHHFSTIDFQKLAVYNTYFNTPIFRP